MLFQTSGYYVYSRGDVGPGEWSVFSSNSKQKLPGSIHQAQASNRNYQEAFLKRLEKIEKNREIITCPMYETFTPLKQPSVLGTGRWSQTSLYHVRIPVDACDPCSTDNAVIWKHVLSPVPVVPSAKDHEWGINVDEQLVIQWMGGATAPDTALQLMCSMCKR